MCVGVGRVRCHAGGCRAEIERETLKQKAMAEAEARAHEARLSEDVNRRLLLEKAQKETEKWVSAINATFSHIGGQCLPLLPPHCHITAVCLPPICYGQQWNQEHHRLG